MVSTPHWSAHFTFDARGRSVVVEQDSPADIEARAYNVFVCPQGFREDQPEYGIPQLLFQTVPLDLTAVQESVARWASIDVSLSEHAEGLEQSIRAITAEVS